MSERLAERLAQALNTELLASFSNPLLVSLMTRGVAHSNAFLWQGEAAFTHVAFVVLGTKHAREPLDWRDDGSRFTTADRH